VYTSFQWLAKGHTPAARAGVCIQPLPPCSEFLVDVVGNVSSTTPPASPITPPQPRQSPPTALLLPNAALQLSLPTRLPRPLSCYRHEVATMEAPKPVVSPLSLLSACCLLHCVHWCSPDPTRLPSPSAPLSTAGAVLRPQGAFSRGSRGAWGAVCIPCAHCLPPPAVFASIPQKSAVAVAYARPGKGLVKLNGERGYYRALAGCC
jgi:hypothetical protein